MRSSMLLVVALGLVACKHDPLHGGTRLTFEVAGTDPQKVADVAWSMSERLDEKGVYEHPDVHVEGNRVIVSLPKVEPDILALTKDVLLRTAKVELRAGTVVIGGEQVAHVENTFDPQSHDAIVDVRFTPEGARAYAALAPDTTLSVALDGKVRATVTVAPPTPEGHAIFRITGAREEVDRRALELGTIIRVGSLPAYRLASETPIE